MTIYGESSNISSTRAAGGLVDCLVLRCAGPLVAPSAARRSVPTHGYTAAHASLALLVRARTGPRPFNDRPDQADLPAADADQPDHPAWRAAAVELIGRHRRVKSGRRTDGVVLPANMAANIPAA